MKSKDEKSDLVKLGNNMRELRLKAGYTSLEKFALENDISRMLYSKYESGHGNPTCKNMLKLCEAYGSKMEVLMKGL